MAEEKNEKKNNSDEKKENKEEQPKVKISFSFKKIVKNKNVPLYLLGFGSSLITFLFFYFSNSIIAPEKIIEKKIDIYKIAKEEAVKLGRIELDDSEKKPIEVGPDGKVIIPSLVYHDIGGMGPNSNKSFVSNLQGSNDYLSMEINFSSYKGEKLGNYLKEYDPDFRNIIMDEIDKRKTPDFMGSKNRKLFLENIKNKMNQYLADKDEDPIIFSANFKTFVINQH